MRFTDLFFRFTKSLTVNKMTLRTMSRMTDKTRQCLTKMAAREQCLSRICYLVGFFIYFWPDYSSGILNSSTGFMGSENMLLLLSGLGIRGSGSGCMSVMTLSAFSFLFVTLSRRWAGVPEGKQTCWHLFNNAWWQPLYSSPLQSSVREGVCHRSVCLSVC